eukprot:TRINITY_DN4805_c0_g1_i8.p1 TRINITY_DN4805_c0_g1~~TRINITY_DN4805_c0_g1_i8.p1  ORF type:complete len:1449 (+),score=316.67 TRINITY_DN4805_c0_g1_i8:17-4363(+)
MPSVVLRRSDAASSGTGSAGSQSTRAVLIANRSGTNSSGSSGGGDHMMPRGVPPSLQGSTQTLKSALHEAEQVDRRGSESGAVFRQVTLESAASLTRARARGTSAARKVLVRSVGKNRAVRLRPGVKVAVGQHSAASGVSLDARVRGLRSDSSARAMNARARLVAARSVHRGTPGTPGDDTHSGGAQDEAGGRVVRSVEGPTSGASQPPVLLRSNGARGRGSGKKGGGTGDHGDGGGADGKAPRRFVAVSPGSRPVGSFAGRGNSRVTGGGNRIAPARLVVAGSAPNVGGRSRDATWWQQDEMPEDAGMDVEEAGEEGQEEEGEAEGNDVGVAAGSRDTGGGNRGRGDSAPPPTPQLRPRRPKGQEQPAPRRPVAAVLVKASDARSSANAPRPPPAANVPPASPSIGGGVRVQRRVVEAVEPTARDSTREDADTRGLEEPVAISNRRVIRDDGGDVGTSWHDSNRPRRSSRPSYDHHDDRVENPEPQDEVDYEMGAPRGSRGSLGPMTSRAQDRDHRIHDRDRERDHDRDDEESAPRGTAHHTDQKVRVAAGRASSSAAVGGLGGGRGAASRRADRDHVATASESAEQRAAASKSRAAAEVPASLVARARNAVPILSARSARTGGPMREKGGGNPASYGRRAAGPEDDAEEEVEDEEEQLPARDARRGTRASGQSRRAAIEDMEEQLPARDARRGTRASGQSRRAAIEDMEEQLPARDARRGTRASGQSRRAAIEDMEEQLPARDARRAARASGQSRRAAVEEMEEELAAPGARRATRAGGQSRRQAAEERSYEADAVEEGEEEKLEHIEMEDEGEEEEYFEGEEEEVLEYEEGEEEEPAEEEMEFEDIADHGHYSDGRRRATSPGRSRRAIAAEGASASAAARGGSSYSRNAVTANSRSSGGQRQREEVSLSRREAAAAELPPPKRQRVSADATCERRQDPVARYPQEQEVEEEWEGEEEELVEEDEEEVEVEEDDDHWQMAGQSPDDNVEFDRHGRRIRIDGANDGVPSASAVRRHDGRGRISAAAMNETSAAIKGRTKSGRHHEDEFEVAHEMEGTAEVSSKRRQADTRADQQETTEGGMTERHASGDRGRDVSRRTGTAADDAAGKSSAAKSARMSNLIANAAIFASNRQQPDSTAEPARVAAAREAASRFSSTGATGRIASSDVHGHGRDEHRRSSWSGGGAAAGGAEASKIAASAGPSRSRRHPEEEAEVMAADEQQRGRTAERRSRAGVAAERSAASAMPSKAVEPQRREGVRRDRERAAAAASALMEERRRREASRERNSKRTRQADEASRETGPRREGREPRSSPARRQTVKDAVREQTIGEERSRQPLPRGGIGSRGDGGETAAPSARARSAERRRVNTAEEGRRHQDHRADTSSAPTKETSGNGTTSRREVEPPSRSALRRAQQRRGEPHRRTDTQESRRRERSRSRRSPRDSGRRI